MGVIGESSGGTPPRGSGSTEALPGMRSTRANRRWSQRKGSLVSSLPANGEFKGRWSYTTRQRKKRIMWKLPQATICTVLQTLAFVLLYSPNKSVHSSTTAFVCALTSSGTPELCVSLFPSVIVMITDGSKKKGLRPWDGKCNIQQLNPSSSKHWPHLFSATLFTALRIKNIPISINIKWSWFPMLMVMAKCRNTIKTEVHLNTVFNKVLASDLCY